MKAGTTSLVLLALPAFLALTPSCKDESSSKDAGASSSSSSSPTGSASSQLAMETPACGKTGYVDKTKDGGPLVVNWTPTIGKEPGRCLKVKAGTSVQWKSANGFAVHPLVAGATGPSNSPIKTTTSGDEATFKFEVPGFYPYACTKRGDMVGTVWVVPES